MLSLYLVSESILVQVIKRYFLFIVVAIFFISPSISEGQGNCLDTVYLKNGGIISGNIISKKRHIYVVIRRYRDTIAYGYSWDEIKRVVYNSSTRDTDKIKMSWMGDMKRLPYYIIVELNEGDTKSKTDTTKIVGIIMPKLIVGFNICERFQIGGGVGFFAYNHSNCFPLFVDFRQYFHLYDVDRIFYSINAGSTVCDGEGQSHSGPYGSFAIGQILALTNRFSLFGSIGGTYEEYRSEFQTETRNNNIFLLSLNVGVKFD